MTLAHDAVNSSNNNNKHATCGTQDAATTLGTEHKCCQRRCRLAPAHTLTMIVTLASISPLPWNGEAACMSAPHLRCHSACGVAKTRCVVVATTIRTSPSLHSNIPQTAGMQRSLVCSMRCTIPLSTELGYRRSGFGRYPHPPQELHGMCNSRQTGRHSFMQAGRGECHVSWLCTQSGAVSSMCVRVCVQRTTTTTPPCLPRCPFLWLLSTRQHGRSPLLHLQVSPPKDTPLPTPHSSSSVTLC